MRRLLLVVLALLGTEIWGSDGDAAKRLPWAATQPLAKLTGLAEPAPGWQFKAPWTGDEPNKQFVGELPAKFDWRTCAKFPPVNRQRSGDCWAQGTAGVLELLAEIHGVRGNERASVQEIIDCSGSGTALRGGYFAHEYHKRNGGVTAVKYPYTGNDDRCRRGGMAAQWGLKQWGYVGAFNTVPTVDEIKAAIYAHGPVAVTITANAPLQRWTGAGVFRGCTNGGTNHIVVIVGWDDTLGVWIMRNSWGPDHGDMGYALIPYNCSRIGERTTWADFSLRG